MTFSHFFHKFFEAILAAFFGTLSLLYRYRLLWQVFFYNLLKNSLYVRAYTRNILIDLAKPVIYLGIKKIDNCAIKTPYK